MDLPSQLNEFIAAIKNVKKPYGKNKEEHAKEILDKARKINKLEKKIIENEKEAELLIKKLRQLKKKRKKSKEKIDELHRSIQEN